MPKRKVLGQMNDNKITKIIHYCWFGGNPLPELALKCIDSWKKYCPEYEIKEWNESNYDLHSCVYVLEAYEAKKWAFVSDYARFDILYKYGGLYFDTDVELIRPIADIVSRGSFMGCEPSAEGEGCNPGLGLAAMPGLPVYKAILDTYDQRHFVLPDGSIDQETIVTFTTDILKTYGFDVANHSIQTVGGVNVYPIDYFCPMDYITGILNITDNTRSIHHFMSSWKTEEELKIFHDGQRYAEKFGRRIGFNMAHYKNAFEKDKIKGVMELTTEKIKRKVSEKFGGGYLELINLDVYSQIQEQHACTYTSVKNVHHMPYFNNCTQLVMDCVA